MDDLGGRTEDLITLRDDHPAEPSQERPGIPNRERINRRYGRILMICGISLLAGTTLTVALIPERITDNAPSLVTSTIVHDCLLLGTAGILASLLEMLTRYTRHLAREGLAREAETREKVDLLIGLTAPLPGRISTLEDHFDKLEQAIAEVPDYGRGVIDGVQMRQDALGGESAERSDHD